MVFTLVDLENPCRRRTIRRRIAGGSHLCPRRPDGLKGRYRRRGRVHSLAAEGMDATFLSVWNTTGVDAAACKALGEPETDLEGLGAKC
jgi:hypothetical protein